MLFGLFKKKKVEIITQEEIANVILDQRVIMFKEGRTCYTDGYVSENYDKYFVVRRLDGEETLVNKKDLDQCEPLTTNGEPVIIFPYLKNIIDKRVKKRLYDIEE